MRSLLNFAWHQYEPTAWTSLSHSVDNQLIVKKQNIQQTGFSDIHSL